MSRRWLLAAVAAAVVVVAGLALLVAGGDDGDDRTAAPKAAAVEVVAGEETFDGCMLLAETRAEQRRGLMETTDLGGYDGMLFDFGEERPLSFWMRNTPMPLSIAFYGADGSFVSSADMAPCGDHDDCPLTPSAGPARYAVEVPQGELERFGLVAGSRLARGGPCRP